MSEAEFGSRTSVAAMRQAFDQAFAVAAAPPASDLEAFLAIRVAGKPFALRVAELRRLEPSRKIVPLPGSSSSLLGLAGIQGRLTPTCRLADLLGLATTSDTSVSTREDRWIAVCGQEEILGLTFEEFEGYLRVARGDVFLGGTGLPAEQATSQAIRGAGAVRPVVHLPAIVARLRERLAIPR